MRSTPALAAAALAALAPALAGHAAIVSTAGAVVAVPAPPSLAEDAFQSNSQIRAIAERQDVALTDDLEVQITVEGLVDAAADLSPGLIPAGTVVRSYLLHVDPLGDGPVELRGTLELSDDVIGIIVGRSLLLASDGPVGLAGVIYSDSVARGLELGADGVSLTVDRRSVGLVVRTTSALDEIRILTVPAAGSGSVALGAVAALARRRRRET